MKFTFKIQKYQMQAVDALVRRQEVGRGMRLCVKEDGSRRDKEPFISRKAIQNLVFTDGSGGDRCASRLSHDEAACGAS